MIVPSAEQQSLRLAKIASVIHIAVEKPVADDIYDAIKDALTLLDTLSQEVERLKNENQELLTRSGKPDADRDFSIHAATDGGKS